MDNVERYQINNEFLMQYFGNDLFLYNKEKHFSKIICNSVEADILQTINNVHALSETWEIIRQQYHIPETMQEYLDWFNKYINLLKDKQIITKGSLDRCIYGVQNDYYPMFATIELTNICNFQCSHCYKEAGPLREKYIPVELVKDIINTIGKSLYSIDLTGGEATLHPYFEEIVSFINGPVLNLLTNGSNLKNIKENTLQKFNQIQVSMYGCSDIDYVKYTNCSAFNSVCMGLDKLVRLNIPTSVVIILRQDNIKCIEEYLNILNNIGVEDIRFGLATKSGRNQLKETEWDISYEQCLEFENQLSKIKEKYPQINISEIDPPSAFKPSLPKGMKYSLVCDGGKSEICISEKGNVRPCVMLPEQYFGNRTWEEYKVKLKEGTCIDYESSIIQCSFDLEKKGKTIDSFCPHAFSCNG